MVFFMNKDIQFNKWLLIASICYAIFALCFGYFYSFTKSFFFAIIANIILIIGCYHHYIGKNLTTNYALIGFVLMFVSFAFDGVDIIHQKPLAKSKNELIQVTGIIPNERFMVQSGKYHDYYFRLGDENLNCAENTSDTCKKAYDYKGQTATAWYQTGAKNGKLLYELKVGNYSIYDFDSQLDFYQKQRQKFYQDIYLTLILYHLPLLIFALLSHYSLKRYYPNLHEDDINIPTQNETSLGVVLLCFISGLSVILGFILLLWGKSYQNHLLSIQGLVIILIFGAIFCFTV